MACTLCVRVHSIQGERLTTIKYCLAACLTMYSFAVFAHGIVHQQIDELTQQIEQNPTNTQLLLKRGLLYTNDQNWLKAREDFNATRQLNSADSVVDFLEAKMWFAANRPELSFTLVNRYLQGNPDVLGALALRAKLNLMLGHANAAVADFASVTGRSKTVLPDMYLQWAKAQATVVPLNQQKVHQIIQAGIDRLGPLVALLEYAMGFDRQQQNDQSALLWLEKLPLKLRQQPFWLIEKATLLESVNKSLEAKMQYKLALDRLQEKKQTGRFNKADQQLFEKINQF